MHQSPSPFRSLTLKQRARFMRHHPTLSEQMLWHMLRSQRLGVRFVRQVPLLGRYLVDFLALASLLIALTHRAMSPSYWLGCVLVGAARQLQPRRQPR